MPDMKTDSFNNLSAFVSDRQIGLGWLSGISVLETKQAVKTDWHRHATTELLICLRGETRYEFRDHPSATLCAGSYLVVPSGVEHRVSNAIDEPGKRIGFNLRHISDPKRKFAVFSPRDYIRFRRQLEGDAFRTHACTPEMRRALSSLERIVDKRRISSVECGHLRILCCSVLYEAVLPPTPKPAVRSKVMDEAVRWLETHFAEDLSTDRLVAFMGYSRARFFTLFHEHTGTSPTDFLHKIRVRRAKELLETTTETSRRIAATCGFADSGYFCRVFKIRTGLTPTEYREILSKEPPPPYQSCPANRPA